MTEKLLGCDVIRHSDGTTTIVSPLVRRYADLKPVQTVIQYAPHGNSKALKKLRAARHDALRGLAE